MRSLYIFFMLNSMFHFSQENYTINTIISKLNNNKFILSNNDLKKATTQDSILISENLENNNIRLNSNFSLNKLFEEKNYIVFLILNDDQIKTVSSTTTSDSTFEILVYSKILKSGILLYFSNSMNLLKIKKNNIEVTIKTSYDLINIEKIVVTNNFEIVRLAEIIWFQYELPIDVKPHTYYKVQDYKDLKQVNVIEDESNYTDKELSKLFTYLLFENKNETIFKVKKEEMFYERLKQN